MTNKKKLDPVTRDGLFVGYKVDSNGQWTQQVLILDREDFEKQKHGSNRRATVHPVHYKEIAPECLRDGRVVEWPVRKGEWKESCEPSSEAPGPAPAPLLTEDGGVCMSSQRRGYDDEVPDSHLVDFDAPDPGGEGEEVAEQRGTEEQRAATELDRDVWQIQGDALVRVHRRPRTTLFSPTGCPDDPPPIGLMYLDAMRATCPVFAGGTVWPGLNMVEDAWVGHAQCDAKL